LVARVSHFFKGFDIVSVECVLMCASTQRVQRAVQQVCIWDSNCFGTPTGTESARSKLSRLLNSKNKFFEYLRLDVVNTICLWNFSSFP
jgi:hypothetical protein